MKEYHGWKGKGIKSSWASENEREFLVWAEANIELKTEVLPFQVFEDTRKHHSLDWRACKKKKAREVLKPIKEPTSPNS